MTTARLAILAYPGVQQAAVLGLADLFTLANRLGQGRVETRIIDGSTLPDMRLDAVLLPPNISGARGQDDTAIHRFLTRQHARGCMLGAACAGVFWLGHAGFLDRRTVTTHWALAPEFRATFPAANLQPDHLLIEEFDLITAGGMMAWVDLGLWFVEHFQGYDTAARTARHLLVDLRGREQRHYRRFVPFLTHGDHAILSVQHWLESRYPERIGVSDMAARAAQSERSFIRRFKTATGLTPGAYLQALRIEKACTLLAHSPEPVARIAWDVGYADVPAFTRAFKSITGLAPRAYRARFKR